MNFGCLGLPTLMQSVAALAVMSAWEFRVTGGFSCPQAAVVVLVQSGPAGSGSGHNSVARDTWPHTSSPANYDGGLATSIVSHSLTHPLICFFLSTQSLTHRVNHATTHPTNHTPSHPLNSALSRCPAGQPGPRQSRRDPSHAWRVRLVPQAGCLPRRLHLAHAARL